MRTELKDAMFYAARVLQHYFDAESVRTTYRKSTGHIEFDIEMKSRDDSPPVWQIDEKRLSEWYRNPGYVWSSVGDNLGIFNDLTELSSDYEEEDEWGACPPIGKVDGKLCADFDSDDFYEIEPVGDEIYDTNVAAHVRAQLGMA